MKKVIVKNRKFAFPYEPGKDYPIELDLPDDAEVVSVRGGVSNGEAVVVVWWTEEETMNAYKGKTASWTGDLEHYEKPADKPPRKRQGGRNAEKRKPRKPEKSGGKTEEG